MGSGNADTHHEVHAASQNGGFAPFNLTHDGCSKAGLGSLLQFYHAAELQNIMVARPQMKCFCGFSLSI